MKVSINPFKYTFGQMSIWASVRHPTSVNIFSYITIVWFCCSVLQICYVCCTWSFCIA